MSRRPDIKKEIRLRPMIFQPAHFAAKMLLGPLFLLTVEGAKRIPRDRACILLPKHQRWEDIPLLSLAAARPLYFIAKHELFANPLSDWFFKSLGGVPLNRANPLKSRNSLKEIDRLLALRQPLVLFPEGTYFPHRMGRGHAGFLRFLHRRFEGPFLPVGIRYAHGFPRTRVAIRFGRPIYSTVDAGSKPFLSVIMEQIARLSDLS